MFFYIGILFAYIALMSAGLAFTGIARTAGSALKVVFFVFLLLMIVSFALALLGIDFATTAPEP